MNLRLQSSLFAPVPADDLTSYYQRLSTLVTSPAPYSSSSSSFPPLPLHAGEVLEVHGGSNTGKSAVLLSCVLSCALPAAVLGWALHGCDRSCVLIDCDSRLSVYRLQCMLEERCSKAWQQHWEAVAGSSASPAAGEQLRVAAARSRRQAVALLTQLVLRRLRVVQVADEVELMAALLTVDRICEAEQSQPRAEQQSSEQQRKQQMVNVAPYFADKHRPLFHTRDEESQQQDSDSSLSHARSIASLPLPHAPSGSRAPAGGSSTSSSPHLVTSHSPVLPLHNISHQSPDPLSQARQGAHNSSQLQSNPIAADGGSAPDLLHLTSAPASSVADVVSALSSLCSASAPPVELLLVDNLAAFYFSARSADRMLAASLPASASSTTNSVYASVSARLRRLLVDRQLAAVVSKPTLFASSASQLQGEWKHSEYLPGEYAQLVRWRLLLRMKADGGSMMDEDGDQASEQLQRRSGVDVDDSGGLRECRLVACREEMGNNGRQPKNTVSFHSTLTHSKEGIVSI